MRETEWVYAIDGKLEDESWPRINDVDWVTAEKYGLDSRLVGLAIGTDHRDSKIVLSHQLIDIHHQHQKRKKAQQHRVAANLLPEKILDRLVFGMINTDSAPPRVLRRLLALRMHLPEKPKESIHNSHKHRHLLHLVAEEPTIGKNRAAEIVGISPNTAKKWMDAPDFKEMVAAIRKNGFKGGQ